jgi:NAD(P)H dehydrogenase (quinone)
LNRPSCRQINLVPRRDCGLRELFAKFIKEQNQLILPFGEARYAPIAAEDLGRVVAAILADPLGHAGQVYPLFGAKELT